MKLFICKNNENLSLLLCKILFIGFSLIQLSCSTYKAQYGRKINENSIAEANTVKDSLIHQIFLIGDAGNADKEKAKEVLQTFQNRLNKANAASTLIFLGDNIYPNGMPPHKDSADRQLAELKLTNQLQLTENFKGKYFFIPGNHDWIYGLQSVSEQAEFVTSYTKNKKSFLPQKACGIEDFKINDRLALIVIDSQWFLEDWNLHKNMNEKCSIKNREDFFEEFKNLVNDHQNRATFVVLHHPIISNGSHGGQYSLLKQIFPFDNKIPLPVVGSLINLVRKTSGLSPQDAQHKQYRELSTRIETLIKDKSNIVFVSGHDHNLQYLEKNYIKQIISGSGSKREAARAINDNDFSYGGNGFAVIDVYKNGTSIVNYYGVENANEKLLFSKKIIELKLEDHTEFPTEFPKTVKAQVYPTQLNLKSDLYKILFGKHYRYYYTKSIEAPTLDLSTHLGGLTPIKKGGGNQSRSLRLVDKEGKEYNLRALHKSATQFVQNLAFKNQYIEKEIKNTITDRFILDFYTTTHPYYPFVIHELASPIGIYHTTPELYFVPKQKQLGIYNDDFGDELYMLEERPMKKFTNLDSFGNADNIVSTNKMIENVLSDEKYQIDYKNYIRARLFDMLIGDWDRHADQWRWAEFKQNKKVLYRPIARDHDQAFPKYDGAIISFIMRMPALKHMQTFGSEIKNVKWFNKEPYPLDLFVTNKATLQDWIDEAEHIAQQLTPEVIENSFRNLPKEVKDINVDVIKVLLQQRIPQLKKYAIEYYEVLQNKMIVYGTHKDDCFVIDRFNNGTTKVEVYRLKKDGDELIYEQTFNKDLTKEIWLYGLHDQDMFHVRGNAKNPIKVRLIGGFHQDEYWIDNGKKVFIYDFKSNKINYKRINGAVTRISNDYNTNIFDYRKPQYNRMQILPNGSYNPDDGLALGINYTYVVNNFIRNPFTQKHQVLANLFFLTGSVSVDYMGTFAHFIDKWNLEIGAGFTNATFSSNFFGLGNETKNLVHEEDFSMEYYRVRQQNIYISPALSYTFQNHGKLSFKSKFERIKVKQSDERITYNHPDINPEVYDGQYFGELGFHYLYKNYDNLAQPTVGFLFEMGGFWKANLQNISGHLPYMFGSIGFTQKITRNNVLTFSSRLKGKWLMRNTFEFHQAATLGGDEDLRAYPRGRFAGKTSLLHSSDFRVKVGKIRSFVPMNYGFLIGYDIGRVWLDGEHSEKLHQSLGTSLWLSGADVISGKVGFFYGEEGGRITVGVNFGF